MIVWLRGVRARLVVTYLLAAAILAAAGVIVFSIALGRGLQDNVDAALQTRAASLSADVAAGRITAGVPAPTIEASAHGVGELSAFTAVYSPAGTLVDATPNRLPASPLTAKQLRERPVQAAYRTAGFGSGAPFRIIAQPVTRTDGTWVIVVGESLDSATDANEEVRQALLVAVPILLILVGVGAWFLSGAALKPVDRMRADAQALSEHDASGRITEPATRDSLNDLAQTFNELLDRLHNSLDRQRGLVADAGHELRTPLAVLQTELETAVRPNRTRADLVDSIEHARVEVGRLAALAEDLLLLAQADGGQTLVRRQLSDVNELIDNVVRTYDDRTDAPRIVVDSARDVIADVDPVAVRRVLDNLVANAARHTPADGTVTIRSELADGPAPPLLVLSVSDSGPGFDAAFLPHAFERFTRADQSRGRSAATSGSGLGLAIVDTLVRAHGGSVTVGNNQIDGAIVEVRLPLPPD